VLVRASHQSVNNFDAPLLLMRRYFLNFASRSAIVPKPLPPVP
jgi:hypothetical protein